MDLGEIHRSVENYYTSRVRAHGATPRGVDWNSRESQHLRFQQLAKVIDFSKPISVNDYGCGYGALVDYLEAQNVDYQYFGFDLSKEMISSAEEFHKGLQHCLFFADERLLSSADYTVASGIFNVRMEISDAPWRDYILDTLNKLDTISTKGFSFNALTKYSDSEYMRPDLYYADPSELFDFCKTHFSKYVALLHDYPLYEFTILVRKES